MTPSSNCTKGSWQLGHSPSLDYIFVCHKTLTPTQLPDLQRECIITCNSNIKSQKNKWESDGLMDIYFVVGVTTIPYPKFGVIINIIFKEDNSYCVTIGDIPQSRCLNFIELSSMALEQKGKGCIANTYTMCSKIYVKWITTWKVHTRSNIYLQQGHATTWACQCCWTQVVMLI